LHHKPKQRRPAIRTAKAHQKHTDQPTTAQIKQEEKKKKKDARKKRQRDAEALGDDAPAKKVAKTQDNTREADETLVAADDAEVKGDEAIDEFSSHFTNTSHPKIVITTNYTPSKQAYEFIRDLLQVFPNSVYYKRKNFAMKEIIADAIEKEYTDLIVLNEDRKEFNGLTMTHLPEGPTAFFKLSSVMLSKDVPGRGAMTSHKPEVILNNFNTRLGHRIGRLFGSLFHQEPNFRGRRVATFHNQRDFIFFRQHRYIFVSSANRIRSRCHVGFLLCALCFSVMTTRAHDFRKQSHTASLSYCCFFFCLVRE
jgi:ribosome production factor 1